MQLWGTRDNFNVIYTLICVSDCQFPPRSLSSTETYASRNLFDFYRKYHLIAYFSHHWNSFKWQVVGSAIKRWIKTAKSGWMRYNVSISSTSETLFHVSLGCFFFLKPWFNTQKRKKLSIPKYTSPALTNRTMIK